MQEPRPGKRHRIQAKTGPAIAEVVHHIWLSVPGATSAFPADLACVCCRSMASAAVAQIIWAFPKDYAAIAAATGGIRNLTINDISAFVSPAQASSWTASQVPIQHIKDLAASRLVAQHGGWYTDFDIVGVRPVQSWPRWMGHAFALPPVQAHGCRQWKEPLISLAIFRATAGSPVLRKHAEECISFITKYAAQGRKPAKKPSRWPRDWMETTRMLHKLVHEHSFSAAAFPCSVFMPWPQWLRQWPPGTRACLAKVAEPFAAPQLPASEPLAGPQGSAELAGKYTVPSTDEVLSTACAVNLWQRQWPEHVLHHALSWAHDMSAAAGAAGHLCTEGVQAATVPESAQSRAGCRAARASSSSSSKEQDQQAREAAPVSASLPARAAEPPILPARATEPPLTATGATHADSRSCKPPEGFQGMEGDAPANRELRSELWQLAYGLGLDEPCSLETLAVALRWARELASKDGNAARQVQDWPACVLACALISLAIGFTQSAVWAEPLDAAAELLNTAAERLDRVAEPFGAALKPTTTALEHARSQCWAALATRMGSSALPQAALEAQLINALGSSEH